MTSQRVVLLHTTGPLKDIPQIGGTVDQLKADAQTSELPTLLEAKTFKASLIAVKPRYVLYRELMTPQSYGSMNPAQR